MRTQVFQDLVYEKLTTLPGGIPAQRARAALKLSAAVGKVTYSVGNREFCKAGQPVSGEDIKEALSSSLFWLSAVASVHGFSIEHLMDETAKKLKS